MVLIEVGAQSNTKEEIKLQ
ncbi:MAG: hypothetical protein ACLR43_09560 [Faecalibacillus faecis]